VKANLVPAANKVAQILKSHPEVVAMRAAGTCHILEDQTLELYNSFSDPEMDAVFRDVEENGQQAMFK
jgi:hypothetical protein